MSAPHAPGGTGHEVRSAPNTARFVHRPRHAVTAILPAEAAEACRQALSDAEVSTSAVDLLVGPEGRAILDGSGGGRRAELARTLQRAGAAGPLLEEYGAALDRGAAVVAVPVEDRAEASAAAVVLRGAGASSVQYFTGRSLVEPL